MANIYLKVTFEMRRFLGLKNLSAGQFSGTSNSTHISLNFKTSRCKTSGSKTVWLFYYFNFERNYDVLKSKSPCTLLNKNINLIKTKRNQNWKIPHTVLETRTLCFSSYKNCKLKVKL